MTRQFAEAIGNVLDELIDTECPPLVFNEYFGHSLDLIADLLTAHAIDREDVVQTLGLGCEEL